MSKTKDVEIPEVAEAEVKEVVKAPSKKLSTVRAIQNHNCNIAGVEINLEKDQEYDLPEDQVAILQNAGIVIKK